MQSADKVDLLGLARLPCITKDDSSYYSAKLFCGYAIALSLRLAISHRNRST
jgi:hypothetical protein